VVGAWVLEEVSADRLLPEPVWTIDTLRIGPHPREDAYGPHETRTTGNSAAWGDEWRFDAATGQLASLVWGIPETNAALSRAWVGVPDTLSALRLLEWEGEVGMPDVRIFEGSWLACGRDEPLVEPHAAWIAPGLAVLSHPTGRWWGWALRDPVSYLPGAPAPGVLVPMLAEWFRLVSTETLDALQRSDPELARRLVSLRHRAQSLGHVAAELLTARIDDVLDRFYPSPGVTP
jgi:hypothetical protein